MESNRINEAFIKWFEKEYNDSWQIYLADGEESHHPMEIHNGYSEGYKQSRIDTLKEVGEFGINLGLRNFINAELEELK